LIAEIGTQAMDIVRTQGEIKASEEGRKELKAQGKDNPTQKELEATAAYQNVMREYGTGSDYQKAAQAVTAALQYLAGGDIGGAIAGASAPYIAHLIKQQTGDNDTARIMAQALLGAVVAGVQGNSSVAGGIGAATGELIAANLYPGKKPEDLTENERQIVSALSSLAAGMAGGLASGDTAGAVAAAGAGKTAVDNNFLSGDQTKAFDHEMQQCTKEGDCTKVIKKYVALNEENRELLKATCLEKPWVCYGNSRDVVLTGLNSADPSRPVSFGGIENDNVRLFVQYENSLDLQYINKNTDTLYKALVFASEPENFMLMFGGLANLTSASGTSIATGAGLGMAANGGVQFATGNTGDKFDWLGFMTSGVTGGMSAGQTLTPTLQTNIGGAYISSQLSGQNSTDAMMGAMLGSIVGYGVGAGIAGQLEKNYVNKIFGLSGNSVSSLKYSEIPAFPGSYLYKETPMSPIPGVAGGIGGSAASEISNSAAMNDLSKEK
ncbi:VENN motif pre-toxin domain-containing protein, partial [Pseudomonas citronellolis]